MDAVFDIESAEGRQLAFAHVLMTAAFSCYNIIFTKIDATLIAHTVRYAVCSIRMRRHSFIY